MTLEEKLKAVRSKLEEGGQLHVVTRRAVDELIMSHAARLALKAGAAAPNFTLRDANDGLVSSDMLLRKGALVVNFFRGAWCPHCSFELRALQESLENYARAGASLVAVAPQTVDVSHAAAKEDSLGYPVLSDHRSRVAEAFGLVFELPEYLSDAYKEIGLNLPGFSGDNRWVLPMPARYVIGRGGIILYSEVDPDHTRRPKPDEIIPVLEQAKLARS